jgi:hypothetical protein
MLRTLLGASVVLTPLAALAQKAAPAKQHHYTAHKPTGSYRSQMRHRSNMSKQRARAGAEHMRTMRQQ